MAIRDEKISLEAITGESGSKAPEALAQGAVPWLLAGGGLLVLAAAELALGPGPGRLDAWMLRSLAARGITPGLVGIAGIVILALYLVARSQRRASIALQHGSSSPDDAIAALAGSTAEIRGGIQELRVEIVYLKDSLRSLAERSGGDAGEPGQNDAMFRLAASLDQLGARVEQRLKTQHLDVQDTLLEIHGLVDSISARIVELVRPAADDEPDADSDDDFEPRLELPAVSSVVARKKDSKDELAWPPLDEENRTNLGLLDALDDLGQLLPSRTSPSLAPPAEQAQAVAAIPETPGEPPAPLPRVSAIQLDPTRYEPPIEDKLGQLTALLADPAVREALEAVRRGP